jgi:hypothetical protein
MWSVKSSHRDDDGQDIVTSTVRTHQRVAQKVCLPSLLDGYVGYGAKNLSETP